ncbi:MAG: nucleotidyltransferase [Cyanothece sp. SIO2G6]|nr:nucleotidyltransferase [Cyanothece sp. SIO2G6]
MGKGRSLTPPLLLFQKAIAFKQGWRRCGLFGSFVHDADIHDQSDVDLLITFEISQKTFDNFMNLSFFLEGLLGRDVDLVTIESLSPHIGLHILREVEYVSLNS